VCPRWRKIAEDTSGLWNCFHIPYKSSHKVECITDIAREVIWHSSSLIHFISTGPDDKRTEGKYFFSLPLLELFTPHGNQAQSLHLELPNCWDFTLLIIGLHLALFDSMEKYQIFLQTWMDKNNGYHVNAFNSFNFSIFDDSPNTCIFF
jgi:hypothetical protein